MANFDSLIQMFRDTLAEMTGSDVRKPNEGLVNLTEIARRQERPRPDDLLRLLALGPSALPAMTSKSYREFINFLPGMFGDMQDLRPAEDPTAIRNARLASAYHNPTSGGATPISNATSVKIMADVPRLSDIPGNALDTLYNYRLPIRYR